MQLGPDSFGKPSERRSLNLSMHLWHLGDRLPILRTSTPNHLGDAIVPAIVNMCEAFFFAVTTAAPLLLSTHE